MFIVQDADSLQNEKVLNFKCNAKEIRKENNMRI